jgi:hypothetical protein
LIQVVLYHFSPNTFNNVYILLGQQIYIQSLDKSDFANLQSHNIIYLDPLFTISEDNFKSIENNSLLIFDDFMLSSTTNQKQQQMSLLKIFNYHLRHRNIVLILVIHNLYSTGLLNMILLAPHLIFAYSNLGFYLLRSDILFI